MKLTVGWIALVFLLAVSSLAPVWAQSSTSTVRGTVLDQTQSAIPAAEIRLTNTETNFSRITQSNNAGQYVFPGITPGPYKIVATSPGMRQFEGTLTVQVAQDAVVAIALQVAQSATEVQVQDVTPMV